MSAGKRPIFPLAACLACLLVLPSAADDNADARERTRQTLVFGIDSQVLEIVQRIKTARDTSFTKELAGLVAEQRSTEVRRAIFDLFADQKLRDGEGAAKEILSSWQDQPTDMLISAVSYLSAVETPGIYRRLVPLMDSTDGGVLSSVTRAIGKTRDPAAGALLTEKLANPDFPDARKADIILALGDLGDPSVADVLIAIIKNQDEEKIRRMYAADALGRIHAVKALPELKKLFGEPDALIRAYAASALANFSVSEVFSLLIQGLKDENWKVREQSAKALARPLTGTQAKTAVPILSWKAENDPIKQVRVQAINTLGEVGGDAAAKSVIRLYGDRGKSLEIREAALNVMVQKALPGAKEAILEVLSDEGKTVDQKPVELTARVVSSAKGDAFSDVFARLLKSENPYARLYAARAIGANRLSAFKSQLAAMAENDPNQSVRAEASKALTKM